MITFHTYIYIVILYYPFPPYQPHPSLMTRCTISPSYFWWRSSSIFLLDLALDSNVQNDAIQTGRRCWAGLRTIEWRLFVCHFDLTAATHIYPYIWQYHNTTNIRGKHQKLPLFAASILKFGVCCTSCWECARLKSEIKAKPITFHGPRSEDTLSLRIHRDFLSIAFLWKELLQRVKI